jgi:hypothetical protein
VVISRLDLGRLPPSLLPPKLNLGGRLSAELPSPSRDKAEGARAQRSAGGNQPAIEAHATWSAGHIGALREVELTTDARLAAGRASGHVELSTLGARSNASFDLPAAWPPPTTAAPLSVDATASNIDLRRVVAGLRTAQGQLASGGVTAVLEKPPLDVRGVASAASQGRRHRREARADDRVQGGAPGGERNGRRGRRGRGGRWYAPAAGARRPPGAAPGIDVGRTRVDGARRRHESGPVWRSRRCCATRQPSRNCSPPPSR